MFSYLEKQHNCHMVFDHTVPDINMSNFSREDWDNTVYSNKRGKLKVDILTNLPTSLGNGFCMRIYVDSDHTGDQVSQQCFDLLDIEEADND